MNHVNQQRPLYLGTKRDKIGYFATIFNIFVQSLIGQGFEDDILMQVMENQKVKKDLGAYLTYFCSIECL